MLKKISHIILATLLIVLTIGMVISKHYCHDEMVTVSVFYEKESCCETEGCCKNETFTFQIENNFSTSAELTIPDSVELDILNNELFNVKNIFDSDDLNIYSYTAESRKPKSIQTLLSLKQVYLL